MSLGFFLLFVIAFIIFHGVLGLLVEFANLFLQVLGLNRPGNCVHQILKWHAIMDLTSVYCQDRLNL